MESPINLRTEYVAPFYDILLNLEKEGYIFLDVKIKTFQKRNGNFGVKVKVRAVKKNELHAPDKWIEFKFTTENLKHEGMTEELYVNVLKDVSQIRMIMA